MPTPITNFRALRVSPGNLYVGDGTPSTAVDGSDVYIEGTLEVDGALNLDGALQLDGAFTVGSSGSGQDVIFYGDTATACMTWDASDDRLEFTLGRMSFGTLSSENQTGVHLTSTKNSVLDVFADDNDTTLGDAVYTTVRGRTMLFKACTHGTIVSVRGQLKFADEADMGPGVFAGVQGYLELVDDADVKSGGKMWAVDASIDVPGDPAGILTVDSGGICAGLHAELTGLGTATQSSGGILAGLYIDEQITTGQWGYGVYVTGATQAWYSATTLSGAGTTTRNAMGLVVTDTATNTGNYQRGIHVDYTQAGTKTSTAECNVIAYDLTVTHDVPYAYGYVGYIVASGDPTIGQVAGISLYIDDTGSAVGHITAVDIGLAGGSNSPSDRHCFLRLRNHTAGQPPADTIRCEGNPHSDYLFGFEGAVAPIVVAAVSGSQTHKIAVRVGSTPYYIPLHTA